MTEIPLKPLIRGHAEVREQYVELTDENWVDRVERQTSYYQFARGFVDARRKKQKHDDLNNDSDDDQDTRPRA